jgi:D-sedoheptulose 7-phosphate isomerase
MKNWISDYISEYRRVLDAIPEERVEALIGRLKSSLARDCQIFVIGNGGSATNSSHFVTDLGKGSSDAVGKRFRCLSLNDNVSWLTALGNDYSFEDIFQQQLINYAKPGDMLLVLSVSGNSPNVVKAMSWAKENAVYTVALAGGQAGRITAICHMLCYAFMEKPEIAGC